MKEIEMSKACKLIKKLRGELSLNQEVISETESEIEHSPVEILIPYSSIFAEKRKLLKKPVLVDLKIPDYFLAEKLSEKLQEDFQNALNPALPPMKIVDSVCNSIDFSDQFEYWTECLSHGLNVLLYGAGSKIQVLTHFQNFVIQSKFNVLRVNAFNPVVTVRKILIEVLNFCEFPVKRIANLDRLLSKVLGCLDRFEGSIILLIDSLDSNSLIDTESQLILSRLVAHQRIHCVATMDNYNLLYRWSIDTNLMFNFLYVPCATLEGYGIELSFCDGLKIFDCASSHSTMRGIDYVLKSLTGNQRKILKELAYVHIKDPGGVSFKEFLERCIEETLVLNSKQLKDALVEAIDHQIAVYKTGSKGETIVHLKIDPVILTNKIV